jgi:hypothetical protein
MICFLSISIVWYTPNVKTISPPVKALIDRISKMAYTILNVVKYSYVSDVVNAVQIMHREINLFLYDT